jgi:enterochelin esterase-like enzyme
MQLLHSRSITSVVSGVCRLVPRDVRRFPVVSRRRTASLAVLLLFTFQIRGSSQTSQPPGGVAAQPDTLKFGVAVERDGRSGDVREYSIAAAGGDLVSGTLEVRGRLAGVVEFLDSNGVPLRSTYFFEDGPPSNRIGFVAPGTGNYRVRLKLFERFDSGPLWAPGELVPIVGSASGGYALRLDAVSVAARMGILQPSAREEHPSTRLTRLTQDLREGRTEALVSFWREVAGKGPIVQEIPGNDREFDVTFVWREIYDTRNVLLTWCPRLDDCYMSRLPGTDIWFKTIRLRRGTRVTYRISPNDTPGARRDTAQFDPLNPRRDPDDPTYHFVTTSVLEMPGAPEDQWAVRQPTRRGRIEEKKISSGVLGNDREIWIYTPPGYMASAGPYRLVLLLDGAVYVSNRFLNAPATLDNLINDGRLRPPIVCFDYGNRGNDVSAGGNESKYSQAVARELIPMLRASYPISSNPADVVIGGFSSGGRTAAEIAFFHPSLFGSVLSQSGAFRMRDSAIGEPNASAQAYLTAPRKEIRFYLEVGLYDNVPGADLPVHDLVLDETNLMGNRHLRDVLRAKGYDVTYREVGAAHENVHWRAMLADGLLALLGK